MDDLTPLYAQSRIFVAPTRFAAGIPHKVHEAAASGLPCVVTPLLAEQLGWVACRDVLVGSSPEDFAKACTKLYMEIDVWTDIRDSALQAVNRDCNPLKFAATLDTLYGDVLRDTHQPEVGAINADCTTGRSIVDINWIYATPGSG